MRSLLTLAAALIILTSCGRKNIVINGQFSKHSDTLVYLEELLPGNVYVIDSVRSDEDGKFSFKKINIGEPRLYNLKTSGHTLPLLLAPGEKVRVNSAAATLGEYEISGSSGSELIREIRAILRNGTIRIDSLRNIGTVDAQNEMLQTYLKTKQEHIGFIVDNQGELAGVYALYQRLPGDSYLTDGANDIIYYRMVADSVAVKYPSSPYVKALQNDISTHDSRSRFFETLSNEIQSGRNDLPEIDQTDIYGKKHKVNDINAKVLIIDFWNMGDGSNTLNNAEYRDLYNRYKERGLEIYQVCLTDNKMQWVTAVQNQQIPWIAVSDLQGVQSSILRLYNIKSLPANYIVDQNGDIVARNVFGKNLEQELKKLLD